MFWTIILTTLLLAALLLWCKYYFLLSSVNDTDEKFKRYRIVMIAMTASFAFVVGSYLINSSFTQSKYAKKGMLSYLSPEHKFEIGKAFYLGENLPKDNWQAFNWLLLSSEEGNQEAYELMRLLGYELDGQQPSGDTILGGENSNFAVEVIPAKKLTLRFKDIVGMNEAIQDANQFVEFINDAEKYKSIGAKPPKGMMLYGLPGTGKTLLARAIAGEANATFISVSGAAFEEVFVGKGSSRVRELFDIARKNKPAIIFIDEIDALAPARGGQELFQSQIQTVNQLLSEMGNVDEEKNSGVYVMAATNRLDAVDSALLRPGRFDWQIHITLPSDEERKALLTKLMEKIVAKDVNVELLSERSAGFSRADLANLVNEAAIFAVNNKKTEVDQISFELAFKKIASYEKELSPIFSVKVVSPSEIKTRFADIAGLKEVKKEVIEAIEFLRDPKKFTRLGAEPPSGILIYGPPGTGKTMMARAIAGESKATFIAVSGADFDERYVGVGASRVRELFKLARQYKPSIIFIDEIDALAGKRTGEDASGHHQTLNQFLSEMDNVRDKANEGIIFIGATNRIDTIDPAVLRPGRFDRKIYFRLPSLLEREEIIQSYLKKIHHTPEVSAKALAKITSGYSGADLANLVNEAAIDATTKNKPAVDMASFEEANDKIALGISQGIESYSEEDKKRTAYHEAGHALVGIFHPAQPRTLHKMTIGLRGHSLGVTHFQLEGEKYSITKRELEAQISTSLGGYVAEELIYGKENISAGAGGDLTNANEIVRDMVTQLGMSDNLNLIVAEVFPEEGGIVESAELILNRDYEMAKSILQKNMDKLHLLANTLMEKETLNYVEIVELLKLKPVKKGA